MLTFFLTPFQPPLADFPKKFPLERINASSCVVAFRHSRSSRRSASGRTPRRSASRTTKPPARVAAKPADTLRDRTQSSLAPSAYNARFIAHPPMFFPAWHPKRRKSRTAAAPAWSSFKPIQPSQTARCGCLVWPDFGPVRKLWDCGVRADDVHRDGDRSGRRAEPNCNSTGSQDAPRMAAWLRRFDQHRVRAVVLSVWREPAAVKQL